MVRELADRRQPTLRRLSSGIWLSTDQLARVFYALKVTPRQFEDRFFYEAAWDLGRLTHRPVVFLPRVGPALTVAQGTVWVANRLFSRGLACHSVSLALSFEWTINKSRAVLPSHLPACLLSSHPFYRSLFPPCHGRFVENVTALSTTRKTPAIQWKP